MSFIGKLKKSVRLWTGEEASHQRPPEVPKMVFVHIPKCAGISLVASLKAALGYPVSGGLDIPAAYQAVRARRSQWTADQWMIEWIGFRQALCHYHLASGRPFVSGHMPLGVATACAYAGEYAFITVLRDPVERFISNYLYDRLGPHPVASRSEGMSLREELDAYLDAPEAVWLAREHTFMLGGLDESGGFQEAGAVERAKANLARFAAVGFTDAMDEFAERVGRLIGRHFLVDRQNETAAWADRQGVTKEDYLSLFDAAARQRVKALCAADEAVYAYARSLV